MMQPKSNYVQDKVQRTINEVIDLTTGEIISAEEFFSQEEDVIFTIRRKLEESIQGMRPPRLCCPICHQMVKISGRRNEEKKSIVKFFSHLKDSEHCDIKTTSGFSKEEIEILKYAGVKESQRHIEMKKHIADLLILQSMTDHRINSVKVEKIVKDKQFSSEWRKPDVSVTYNDKKIVFEVQVSATFLSVIVARDDFYANNDMFVIWVFGFMQENLEWQRFMEKDIYYANKRNVFVFDEESKFRSINTGDLVFHCYWQEPIIKNGRVEVAWEDKYVVLDDLKFCEKTNKVYYFDSDTLFYKYEPEKQKLIIDWEQEKISKYARILAKARKQEIERLKRIEAVELFKEETKMNLEKYRLELKENTYGADLIPIEKNKKWGFMTLKNEIVIPYQYDYVFEFNGLYAKVKKNRRYGFINKEGREFIPCEYHECFFFLNDKCIVRKDKKWQVVNTNNEVLEEMNVENIKWFQEELELLLVTKKESVKRYGGRNSSGLRYYVSDINYYVGLIKMDGEVLSPPIYHEIKDFANQKAEAVIRKINYQHNWREGIDYPIIDEIKGELRFNGNAIEGFIHDRRELDNGKALVYRNGFCGLEDEHGNEVIPCVYDFIGHFDANNIAKVMKKQKWGLLKDESEILVDLEYDEIILLSNNSFLIRKKKRFGCLDQLGQSLIPCEYTEILYGDDMYKGRKGEYWGIIDEKGQMITEIHYEEITHFRNNLAKVKKNGRFGYINREGLEKIPCIYTWISPDNHVNMTHNSPDTFLVIDDFYEFKSTTPLPSGLHEVKIGQLSGILNLSEKIEIIPCQFDQIAFVGDLLKVRYNGLQGYYDLYGNSILPCEYEVVEATGLLEFKFKRNGAWGYIDFFNNTSINPKWENIATSNFDLIRVKKNGKWGCIDKNENVVIRCIYDELNDFYQGETTIRNNQNVFKITGLARYVFGDKRGYVDQHGKEYWQYWGDKKNRNNKHKYSSRFKR